MEKILEHWSFNVIMMKNGHPWHQMDRYSLNTMAKTEGSIVRYTSPDNNSELLDSSKTWAEFYSHVSDDKRTDGDTGYKNIKFTILNLCK